VRTSWNLLVAFLIGCGVICQSPHLVQGDDVWQPSMEQAIVAARRDNKDMLLLFTGSDWCPPCKKLEEEILGTGDFVAGTRGEWILVKFDFLRNQPMLPALEAQNEEWSEKLGVTAFPTLVLVDDEQRPFGFLGYQAGGPALFLESLADLKQKRALRDEALQRAAAAEGDEKAAFLDQALSVLDEQLVDVWYADVVEQIVALDGDDHLGLRSKWYGARDAEARKLVFADIQTIARLDRPERAIAFIDEVLEAVEFPVDERFEVLRIKLSLLQQSQQLAAALDLLDQMLAMPEITSETRERLVVKKGLQLFSAGGKDQASGFLDAELEQRPEQYFVRLTRAQLEAGTGQVELAIEMIQKAIPGAVSEPDALVELVATLADLQCKAGKEDDALASLEAFAVDEAVPPDLRAEALLQAAMIMRESGRVRPAMLTENRAVALAKTPELAREMQRVVDDLRKPGGPGNF